MEKKVAVFARDVDFNQMKFRPKNKFKQIRNHADLRGIDFEATLTFFGWHYDPEKVDAYEYLISRNPKLRP